MQHRDAARVRPSRAMASSVTALSVPCRGLHDDGARGAEPLLHAADSPRRLALVDPARRTRGVVDMHVGVAGAARRLELGRCVPVEFGTASDCIAIVPPLGRALRVPAVIDDAPPQDDDRHDALTAVCDP